MLLLALFQLLGGNPNLHFILDLCSGSGAGAVAALSLGFPVLSLDIDPGQRDGFQKRVFNFSSRHRQIIVAAGKGTRENPNTPIPVDEIRFTYGTYADLRECFNYFTRDVEELAAAEKVRCFMLDSVCFKRLFYVLVLFFAEAASHLGRTYG